MPTYGAPKRKLEDFDPNASDPNDSDFEEAPQSASRPSNRRRSQKHSKSASRRPNKRQRRRRGSDSDDDIVDDEEDISHESFSESDSEEEEPEINPTTGRAVRRATKKSITYEESEDNDDDLIEDSTAEVDELSNTPRAKQRNTKRLVIKLPFTDYDKLKGKAKEAVASDLKSAVPQTRRPARNTRSRTASKPPVTPTTAGPIRRSNRLSRDPEQPPTIELTTSGKHTQISSRPATVSPEQAIGRRLGAAGKGLREASAGKQSRKFPSAIMEESMTRTEADADADEPEAGSDEPGAETEVDVADDDADHAEDEGQGVVESVEKDAEGDVEDEGEGEDEVEDVVMNEETEAEHESAQIRESRSPSSEGPIRRSGRNLRVSDGFAM
jgi:hypothetical protein